jgi:hypothetical protein
MSQWFGLRNDRTSEGMNPEDGVANYLRAQGFSTDATGLVTRSNPWGKKVLPARVFSVLLRIRKVTHPHDFNEANLVGDGSHDDCHAV